MKTLWRKISVHADLWLKEPLSCKKAPPKAREFDFRGGGMAVGVTGLHFNTLENNILNSIVYQCFVLQTGKMPDMFHRNAWGGFEDVWFSHYT